MLKDAGFEDVIAEDRTDQVWLALKQLIQTWIHVI